MIEIEAGSDPCGTDVAEKQGSAVTIDQRASILWRGDLRHPNRHGTEEPPGTHTGEEAESDEHGNICSTCEAGSRDQDQDTRNGDGHLSPPPVGNNIDADGPKEGPGLEDALHAGDEGQPI